VIIDRDGGGFLFPPDVILQKIKDGTDLKKDLRVSILMGFFNGLHEQVESFSQNGHAIQGIGSLTLASVKNLSDFERRVIDCMVNDVGVRQLGRSWIQSAFDMDTNPFRLTDDELWFLNIVESDNVIMRFLRSVKLRESQSGNRAAWKAARAYLTHHTHDKADAEEYLNEALAHGSLRASDVIGIQQMFSEWVRMFVQRSTKTANSTLAPWEAEHLLPLPGVEGLEVWANIRMACAQKDYPKASKEIADVRISAHPSLMPQFAHRRWMSEIEKMQEYVASHMTDNTNRKRKKKNATRDVSDPAVPQGT
jgi:hypothetical protein